METVIGYSDEAIRPIDEVVAETMGDLHEYARDRAAAFMQRILPKAAGVEIAYDETDQSLQKNSGEAGGQQQGQQQPTPAPRHVCGKVCSLHGIGGPDYNGNRRRGR